MEAEERESEQSLLLPELWLEIMKYLRIQDLCKVSQVSTFMYNITSTPKLWRNAHIRKIKFKHGEIEEFFQVMKFKKVKKLSFSRLQFSEGCTNTFF